MMHACKRLTVFIVVALFSHGVGPGRCGRETRTHGQIGFFRERAAERVSQGQHELSEKGLP